MQIHITQIHPLISLPGLNLLPETRKTAIQSLIRPEDKARSLAAGLLLRKFCGVTSDTQLTQNEHGKPALLNSQTHFNISHSGDYAVLAVSNREIGVDIEQITPPPPAVTKRVFTPAEQEWLKNEGTDEAFFYLWTAKESLMKATGKGFALPPESFNVLPINPSPRQILNKTWFFHWFNYNNHIICAAIQDIFLQPEIITIHPNDLLK